MRVRRRDRHARLADRQIADAVLGHDVLASEPCAALRHYGFELALGHRTIGGVLDPGHGAPFVLLAYGSDEEHGSAVPRRVNLAQQRLSIDR